MAMSLWAIKKNTGSDWVDFKLDGSWHYTPCPAVYDDFLVARSWRDRANAGGAKCHVVELVEAPAKVVVSAEEDKVLKKAKNTTVWRPAAVISAYAYDNTKDPDIEVLLEDRLMRAYVIGYTVAKEKKYNVKVPLVQTQGGLWFFINSDGKLDATYLQGLAKKFTMDEIKENGLQGCERVDVCVDSVRTTGEVKD